MPPRRMTTRQTVAVDQPEQTDAAQTVPQVPVTVPRTDQGSNSTDALNATATPMETLLKRFQSFKPPTLTGTEAVPLQIIEPTSAATAEQPSIPKRKSMKRKLRLPKGSDDENVANVETPVTVAVTGDTVVEQESAVENVIDEAVPLQIIEPTSAATAEQPSVPKRKSMKRKLRLPKGSDDENVWNVETPVTVAVTEAAVDISEEETVSAFEESEPTVANVPVAKSATEEVIPTSVDDVDVIIEQVIAETAQMGADEEEIDIGGETVSGSAVGSQAVEKAEEDISVVEPVAVSGFRRPAITSWGWYQLGAAFAWFCLLNGLSTVVIRNFVSSIAEERSALRVVQSLNRSVFVSPHVQSIDSSAVQDQHVQSSDESSMHFNDTNAAVTSLSLPTAAADVPDAFAQLCASIDKLRFEQIRRKDDVDKLRDTLLMHIRDLEKEFTERFDAHDRTYRVLLNNIRHDAQDHKNLLSLDIKSSQQKLSIQVAASALDTVDVRKVLKELDAKVTYLDGQVAAIRNDLLNFHAKAEENHLNLSTQLGFLIDYINRGGDAKKREGRSSRPQPPPDDQSRPSGGSGGTGSRAGDQSRSRGNISREDRSRGGESSNERRRTDDRSGHSKRRRSNSGESGMDSGQPPKRGYQWFLFGE
ncbi:hypothetical protein F511_31412 [Dorcoceras hygrometricum]|uniref:Uncharacterized protein n=1 Tax=Dorcoceras hygrometricum TaxID=472368 RepID=A0A2Z7BP58_9LAMI|nr:hypothetical protein F511_31412 [Dorcoceras hygrometricum]